MQKIFKLFIMSELIRAWFTPFKSIISVLGKAFDNILEAIL